MILLISYDLNKHEQSDAYKVVANGIANKAGLGKYKKALFSQYVVDTGKPISEWQSLMKSLTDSDDTFLITRITPGQYRFWLNRDVAQFIDQRVS